MSLVPLTRFDQVIGAGVPAGRPVTATPVVSRPPAPRDLLPLLKSQIAELLQEVGAEGVVFVQKVATVFDGLMLEYTSGAIQDPDFLIKHGTARTMELAAIHLVNVKTRTKDRALHVVQAIWQTAVTMLVPPLGAVLNAGIPTTNPWYSKTGI